MTKVDIFSGFLGAGKTTLIKKLIAEAYRGEKLVLIENEFGEIGIDGGFMQEAGIEVTEMNSGCICCSLVGDFSEALRKVISTYAPDRILIEPSGVGKLSEVITAVRGIASDEIILNSFTTVADAKRCKMYLKNFGEFYIDQIGHASCIVLSRTGELTEAKLDEAVALLREHNADAPIITTPWESLDGMQILEAMEQRDTLEAELAKLMAEHHDDDNEECDDEECECHHHHHHDDDECDDEECECHHHHHHHDDDDDEHEHHHHHHHHHHHDGEHDADEVFVSWGVETAKHFTEADIAAALDKLSDEGKYGLILRAKGIVDAGDGWIHFDYVPGETDIRRGSASVTGRLCVIGSELKESALTELFGV